MKRTGTARILDLSIDKLVAGGNGLAFQDGKAVFISGVMPGERIRVELTEEHPDYDRARLLEILSPSPKRQEPPCPLAGVCGGCDWLHISHPEQLELKKAIVAEALSRVGGLDIGPLAIESGAPLAYRNRAQVHRDRQGRLGFMGFHTHDVVPVESCPVAVPVVNRVFHEGLGVKGRRITVFGDDGSLAVGSGEITVVVCGKPFVFSADCFFQSNLGMLEKLVPFALEGLGAADPDASGAAADLYCGVGIFAAHMAARFTKVIMVESDARSAFYAGRNVQGGGVELRALSVEQWIEAGGAGGPLDAAVVDPPREGLSRAVREYLSAAEIRRLVYVSCNPVTLARDLKALCAGGLRLTALRLFDFFPQTSHVESVAWLARGK